jgi:NADPH:quinone reductase-like Zn-dependent oxidoreductase
MAAPPERLGRLPFTLGHENAGWVEKLGPGATGFAPRDPVIVYGPWGCGTCANEVDGCQTVVTRHPPEGFRQLERQLERQCAETFAALLRDPVDDVVQHEKAELVSLRSAAGVSVWYADCGVDLQECRSARSRVCY